MGSVPPLIPAYKIPGLRIYTDRTRAGVASTRPRTLIVAPCLTAASLPVNEPALVTSLADVAAWDEAALVRFAKAVGKKPAQLEKAGWVESARELLSGRGS